MWKRYKGAVPAVVGLGHIGLYVRDLEQMVGFYRDFLGMKVTAELGSGWDAPRGERVKEYSNA